MLILQMFADAVGTMRIFEVLVVCMALSPAAIPFRLHITIFSAPELLQTKTDSGHDYRGLKFAIGVSQSMLNVEGILVRIYTVTWLWERSFDGTETLVVRQRA